MAIDEDSHREEGAFIAAYRLKNGERLPDHEIEALTTLLRWFENNLDAPNRFDRSRRISGPGRAICWFKDSATGHIVRLWEVTAILESNGIHTEFLKTDTPGYVVYEDEFQVAAEPFKKGTF
jgi:hypothetical protein